MTSTAAGYDAGAIILAGGKSRRMGQNKCLLPYQGIPLIHHVANQLTPLFREVLISSNEPNTYDFLGLPIIGDDVIDQGPLMGIVSALTQSQHDWNLVVAADIPEIPLPLIAELYENTQHHNCVVPITTTGQYQPLFAFYHRDVITPFRERIESGNGRVIDAVNSAQKCEVPIPDGTLENLNTPAQYRNSLK